MDILLIIVMTLCQNYHKNIETFISKNYKGAIIREIEEENYGFEVEFNVGNVSYEADFDKDGNWLLTESEISVSDLPKKILNMLQKKYFDYELEELDLVKKSDNTVYYKIELEKNYYDLVLRFTTEGKKIPFKDGVRKSKPGRKKSISPCSFELFKNIVQTEGYDLNKPDYRYDLPDELLEISGLDLLNDSIIACIQDESGIIFYYNLKNNTIANIINFGDTGDYEDLTLKSSYCYVLRSDGSIFEVCQNKKETHPKQYRLPVECLNNEGFYYNTRKQEFILACKSRNIFDINFTNRYIFFFSLQYDKFNLIRKFVIKNKNLQEKLCSLYKCDIENISGCIFNPSAVAIHPITEDLFILSADSKMLIVFDNNGELKHVQPLNEAIYYKPEGITFYPNGDMLISSEGQKNRDLKGYVLLFKYNRKSID